MLVLSGEIDVNTLQAFDTRTGCLRQAPSPTPFVTVADVPRGDLRRLHGLRFLVRCTHAACASGPQPILRGPTPLVQRVLGLPG